MQEKLSAGQLEALNKILLLEDDILFADTLVDFLQEYSFEIIHVANGQSAIETTYKHKFDLYLLDINVPLIDGITLLKELRDSNDDTPAIFLTSYKDKESLRKSFLNGGDDFITKPFDADELLFRINAILRRASIPLKSPQNMFHHDAMHKRILYNNEELDLSKKEYKLLLLLIKHLNSTVPKEMILYELWSSYESGSEGAIRVYINRIKQLVPQISIENIRGIGYKLVS